MRRTQISLDEPMYEALRRIAFERHTSMAQMVREALVAYIAEPPGAGGPAPSAAEPPGAAAIARSKAPSPAADGQSP